MNIIIQTVYGGRIPNIVRNFNARILPQARRSCSTHPIAKVDNDDTAKSPPKPRRAVRTSTSAPPTTRVTRFIRTVCGHLRCSPRVIQQLLAAEPELAEHTDNADAVCAYLLEQSVTADSLLANTFLLSSPLSSVTAKLPLLQVQRPRNINDFVPLMRASLSRLIKMRKLTAKEAAVLPGGGHRVYYLADRLALQPVVVAQHMSTHLFMFDLSAEQLIENLDVQLKYQVAPINILRDPWAFRYSTKAIEVRLDRAVGGQKDKLMPWMVRCPETILAKSIQHSVAEKQLLGDGTLVDYVAERLGYDAVTTKFILNKHPAIYMVRVTKIKEILDYFLLESEYTANDLAQVPRILCHSLHTTRVRLDELRALGCRPSSLVVVCKSANEYRKFIETWTNRRETLIRRKVIEAEATASTPTVEG